MPRQNDRNYSNSNRNNSNNNARGNRNSNRGGGGGRGNNKFSKANNYNMLNLGTAFLDETSGTSYVFKARVMLKTKDGEQVNVFDGDGKGENEYTPQEAAMLLAKALLEGRAINICFFDNNDGSYGGNARIDINGIELDDEPEEKPAARKSTKTSAKSSAKTTSKRSYEIPADADDEDEDLEDDTDEEDYDDEEAGDRLPY